MSSDNLPRRRIRSPEDSNWPPSIKILRAATGAQSPRTDERCLTYCSQTAAGRTAGRAPTCRSICIRHVFIHELSKLSRSSSKPTIARALGSLDDAEDEQPELDSIPLPTEGQRPGEFFAPLWPPFLSPLQSRADDQEDERRAGPTSAADALRAAGKAVDTDDFGLDNDDEPAKDDAVAAPPRTWAPGTYVWMTRSKWHALDHLNMMMFSLRAQAGWDNYRARMRTEAEERTQAALRDTVSRMRTKQQRKEESKEEAEPKKFQDVTVPKQDEFIPGMGSRRVRASTGLGVPLYPDVSGQSLLVSIPPPMPSLQPAMDRLLAPANRMLTLTAQAWQDGAYVDLAKRCYDKAFGDNWRDPWHLLGMAWKTVLETKNGEDE